MEWLYNNWTLIVAAAAGIIVIIGAIVAFVKLPVAVQIKKIKEWLLLAVTEAEKELGGGTGQIKLRYTYDLFISKFKFISTLVSFDTFSKWVDCALEKMKEMLATNVAVSLYVGIEDKTESEG